MRLSHPVAMTQIDNRQNETDIYANETEGNSPHDNDDPAVHSHVENRKLGWKEGQSDRVTRDQTKAVIDYHSAGPDVYAEVNKPSKIPGTSSALKAEGTGLVKTGDYLPEEIYSLASEPDIYANEPTAVHSATQLMLEAVSEASSPQDDEDQTVIDNDLYCH